MSLVEAVLIYRPNGVGEKTGDIPIGRTDNPYVLRVLRDQLVEEAMEEVYLWKGIDPGVATMRKADVERLVRILHLILPDEEVRVELKAIEGNRE